MNLQEVIDRLASLPPDQQQATLKTIAATTGKRKFIPSPGPQTEAWFSPADVLLYGGAAGGGKSSILCGLALGEHQRSLLMRRTYSSLEGGGTLVEELLRFYGSRQGFNGSKPMVLRTDDGRVITFGAANNIGDEETFQGRPRDFLGIDEAVQFAESQVRHLMGWVRSEEAGQRKRTVLATNPPLDSTGDWIIGMFRPWLDLTHPNPARPGELRWYVTDPDGGEIEVDGPTPVVFDGKAVRPESRTFIPALLSDNPFLVDTGYDAKLDAMPEPMRSAMRDGNFMLARHDSDYQVIPTQWLREAQARWRPEPPEHAPMCALAVDIAQGGDDSTVFSARYDHWFAPLEKIPGNETPTGNEIAGLIVGRRRNAAAIVLDMGGGFGGATKMRLDDNGVTGVVAFKGSNTSGRRTVDHQFGFYNDRAEAYWRLREALDPAQDGGATIALPDDPELVSDLTAVQFRITSRGIKVTPKDDHTDDRFGKSVKALLGRSPDKGDALVMANFAGPRHLTHGNQWRTFSREQLPGSPVRINMSHSAARRRR